MKVPWKKDRHGATQRIKRFKRRTQRCLYWAATVSNVASPWIAIWIAHSK